MTHEDPAVPKDDGGDVVLFLIALLSFGGVLWEIIAWGPAQGCLVVFAGLGFGCGH